MTLSDGIILALLTAFIGPTVVVFIKNQLYLRNKERKNNNNTIENEIDESIVISDELDEIRDYLDADRVWISMFHNGSHYLHSMKSMKKYSVVHESCKLGVSSRSLVVKDVPISVYLKYIQQLNTGGSINIENVDDTNTIKYGIESTLESLGTKSSYAVGLFDIIDEKFIGVMGVDYLQPSNLSNEEKNYFKEKSLRMAGFISNFIKI